MHQLSCNITNTDLSVGGVILVPLTSSLIIQKGLDITLLDFDPIQEDRLVKDGARLSDPYVPSLEDLFLDGNQISDI